MLPLPLANILQHKLRSLLTAAGIAVAVCMLITLSGLAQGSLAENADRWDSVDADLALLPRGLGTNSVTISGSQLSDGLADLILQKHGDIVEQVVPVFRWQVHMGGQNQAAVGVDPEQWRFLSGQDDVSHGRLFDPDHRFANWLDEQLLGPAADGELPDLSAEQLGHPDHNGLELVIDDRLARAGDYKLGQTVHMAEHDWTIVGIVPAGGMTRVYMPRRTAQFLAGGNIRRSTFMFIKLAPGTTPHQAAKAISRTTRANAVPLADYRSQLESMFEMMFVYVDMINMVAMGIAFLFIMVMLYAMVLQRTRDIAILMANGASNMFLLGQVVGESLIMTGMGVVGGIGLSFLAAWLIGVFRPLLTVEITAQWILTAIVIAAIGAVASAIYPAWRATRVDMVEALTME